MPLSRPKHLALSLLAIEIPYPESDSDHPHGPPVEVPRSLGKMLTTAIPDIAYRSVEEWNEGSPPFETDWRSIIADYESLCSALKTLAATGRADRDALRRGEAAVGRMIGAVVEDEEGARAMLDADSPENKAFLERLGATLAEAARDAVESYFSYLCFRCTRDALESLRDGLREINLTIDKGPPSPAR